MTSPDQEAGQIASAPEAGPQQSAAQIENKARSPGGRILGFDVARALAILGMIVVHFGLVAGADPAEPSWMAGIMALLDGRAAATFVVLAGIGLSLMSRRAVASGDPEMLGAARGKLVRRGLFLLVLGFVNLSIWPGDILRVYGVSMVLASFLLLSSGRRLLGLAASLVVTYGVLVLFADFERNWDWETLTYHHLWTPLGALRNLFFDGFRSVLPWTGLVLYGMWLGRLDWTQRRTRYWLLGGSLTLFLCAELCSRSIVSLLLAHPVEGLDEETVRALFGTGSLPALPLFLGSAVGAATALIALCVGCVLQWPGRKWQPLVATGQMALTWYMAHIVLGLGTLVGLGKVSTESLGQAGLYGLGFFVLAVVFSWTWKARWAHGPLEWLQRRLTG